ncbi:MAG: AAA family ATPase, partial [Caldisphaera sp.]|uniref:AAA family ATPase n=1 Tax=Caldisphaera sp. TaxID=2060322 RepID=UPI003D0BA6AE
TESGANFITVRGPEVLSKWVGESEKAIREIFKKARQYAPAVVFFDEIDAIAALRGTDEGTRVGERIVSQLLTEIDGITDLQNVVVIAATNRPEMVDPALIRPGRLEKLVYVPPPDERGRLEILQIHTRTVPLGDDVDLVDIAKRTNGYTGADLAALVREAAMGALREDLQNGIVKKRHFDVALSKVKPSVTQYMIDYYMKWMETARQINPGRSTATSITY